MPVSQIEQVPVAQLRPNPLNFHTHNKKQINALDRMIGQVGFIVPIARDDRGFILAGHGRWLAAKQRGMSHVPVVTVSGLSEAKARAYMLADNRLTEQAGWDRAGLAAELTQLVPLLAEADLDIELPASKLLTSTDCLASYAIPKPIRPTRPPRRLKQLPQ